ncbi:uncharacterized protein LTR77_001970 [Saxophila tyrrhenica]|uniref:Arabinan endo-1,5-alpha-L-arabinosidase n=1 Tax=Saxophila tyrrhenica TaxID=1690608 RepID=A0AAV9PI72_9PEZI|nr:hypothetical protein LTR77_001970 [Saxophila tyrrhenica]
MHLFAVLPLLSLLTPLITAFSSPLPCTGTCTNTHDPALLQRGSDGTYFRFATGGRLPIHTSPSLTGPWTYVGDVLPEGGSSIDNPGADDAWAPDVHEVDGTYYCYYSVSSFGTQDSAIGVATSSSMDPGTWTDHGATGLSSSEGDDYNAIDANLVVQADEGEAHLAFGSFWGDIFTTTLASSLLTISGDASPVQIELNNTGTRPSEGAYIHQRDGSFWLFFSSGICCGYDGDRPAPGEEYKIMVCKSDAVEGPYVDADGTSCLSNGGTLVLGSHDNVYGPGGQGVYADAEYGDVLYYHYVDTNIGYSDGQKQLGISVIDWSSGWPVV